MLTSRKHQLGAALLNTRRLDEGALTAIVRQPEHSTIQRIAALRWLIHQAPIDVTQGRPYAERRRLVRDHYHV